MRLFSFPILFLGKILKERSLFSNDIAGGTDYFYSNNKCALGIAVR